jgi:8-oxo-dGTP pyrophosphatase MutT (NUDIX family)
MGGSEASVSSCLLEQLGVAYGTVHSIPVSVVETLSSIELTRSKVGIPLGHAQDCPAAQGGGTELAGSFKIGCVTCVCDSRGRVLFTKRPMHFRAFPGNWVMPGGKVDPGETLRQAACRELHEEVGIDAREEQLELVCLWESCFPIRKSDGPLKSHVLALFFRLRLDLPFERIEVKVDSEEVDDFKWMVPSQVAEVLGIEDVSEGHKFALKFL